MNISCVKNSDCTVCKHKYDMQIESENKKQGSVLYIFGGGDTIIEENICSSENPRSLI